MVLVFWFLLSLLILLVSKFSEATYCDYSLGNFYAIKESFIGADVIGSLRCSPGSFFSPTISSTVTIYSNLLRCLEISPGYVTSPGTGAVLWVSGTVLTTVVAGVTTLLCPALARTPGFTFLDCFSELGGYLCAMPVTAFATTSTSTSLTTVRTDSITSISITPSTLTVFLLTATTTTQLDVIGSIIIISQTRTSITSETSTIDSSTSTSTTFTETFSFLTITTTTTSFTQTEFSTISSETTSTSTSTTTSTFTTCSTSF